MAMRRACMHPAQGNEAALHAVGAVVARSSNWAPPAAATSKTWIIKEYLALAIPRPLLLYGARTKHSYPEPWLTTEQLELQQRLRLQDLARVGDDCSLTLVRQDFKADSNRMHAEPSSCHVGPGGLWEGHPGCQQSKGASAQARETQKRIAPQGDLQYTVGHHATEDLQKSCENQACKAWPPPELTREAQHSRVRLVAAGEAEAKGETGHCY